jgi:menaquinone-dependent protoporphyrinogen IX oxidase
MKTLIVYCSKTGTTDKVAHALRRALPEETDMLRLDLNVIGLQQTYNANFTVDLEDYDLIFLGGWTMVMRVHPFMACYIRECLNLEHKTIAGFFTGAAIFSRAHVRSDLEQLLAQQGARLIDFHYITTLFGPALTQAKLRRAEDFARGVLEEHQRLAEAQGR